MTFAEELERLADAAVTHPRGAPRPAFSRLRLPVYGKIVVPQRARMLLALHAAEGRLALDVLARYGALTNQR